MSRAAYQPTKLEAALAAAREDAEKFTRFFELFLAAELLVPIAPDTDLPLGHARIEANTNIGFVTLQFRGRPIVPVFDSEAGLAAWAESPQQRFFATGGADLLRMLPEDLLLVLNPQSEQVKIFEPDELIWLREYAAATPRAAKPESKQLRLAAIGELAPELQEAIDAVLPRFADVASLVLAALHADGRPPRLLALLEVSSGDGVASLVDPLAAALRPYLQGTELDIADVASLGGRAALEAAGFKTFYMRAF